MIQQMEAAAAQLGLENRSDVVKLCVRSFLAHIAAHGAASLPVNWKELVRDLDGRTHRYTQQRLLAADGAESYNQQRKRRTKKNGGNA
jgi:hypothetical protein